MLTKADFEKIITDSVANYPTLMPLFQAKDPRVLQPLNAMASMLSMLSAQVDVAVFETFQKTRESTILADAAMRGIIPKGKPANARISIENKSSSQYTISAGRLMTDATGKYWVVTSGAVVGAGQSAFITAVQQTENASTHTVSNANPFYSIEIAKPDDDDLFLSAIAVSDKNGELQWKDRYVNALPGDRVYHVEIDDRSRIFVRFGFDGVVGHSPLIGDIITIKTTWTHGANAQPKAQSPFALDAIISPLDAFVSLKLDAIIESGVNPVGINTLRDMAKYPIAYDHNAVFLGEFDYLIRRRFPELPFVAAWNEAIEEKTRGARIDNINCLFVSIAEISQIASLPIELTTQSNFTEKPLSSATTKELAVIAAINEADNSYKVRLISPVVRPVTVTVDASVAKVYPLDEVQDQIKQLILSSYGVIGYEAGDRFVKPSFSAVFALLKSNIVSLQDALSDVKVTVSLPSLPEKPEALYLVTPESVVVTVSHSDSQRMGWS